MTQESKDKRKKEDIELSSLENISNETLLLNEIDEQHRTNAEPQNSPRRSTLSPSNNIIDDDYVEKDSVDSVSESNNDDSNQQLRSSAQKKEIKERMRIHSEGAIKENREVREPVLSNTGQNFGFQKKNSSDNEVEDTDGDLKKNVSIDFILDEQSSEENDIEKVKRPNRTITKSLDKDDEQNSIVSDTAIKNRKVKSGKLIFIDFSNF